jgi:hypothetical protein
VTASLSEPLTNETINRAALFRPLSQPCIFLVTTFHLSMLQVPYSLTSRVVPRTRDFGLHYHALTESVHRDGVLALSRQNSALPAAKVRLVASKAE